MDSRRTSRLQALCRAAMPVAIQVQRSLKPMAVFADEEGFRAVPASQVKGNPDETWVCCLHGGDKDAIEIAAEIVFNAVRVGDD